MVERCAIEGCIYQPVGSVNRTAKSPTRRFCRYHVDEVIAMTLGQPGTIDSGLEKVFRGIVKERKWRDRMRPTEAGHEDS